MKTGSTTAMEKTTTAATAGTVAAAKAVTDPAETSSPRAPADGWPGLRVPGLEVRRAFPVQAFDQGFHPVDVEHFAGPIADDPAFVLRGDVKEVSRCQVHLAAV